MAFVHLRPFEEFVLSYRDLLKIPPFRNLWLAQAISQLGDSFYFVVSMFMAEKLTGSLAMVGVVGAAGSLPFLVFGPYAGVLADRMDRRLILLYSDASSGALLILFGAFVGLGYTPAWLLATVPFLLGTLRVFFLPAKNAALPNVVPTSTLISANSLSMLTQTMMPMLGLAASATILAPLYDGLGNAFYLAAILINAGSFFGSAWFVRNLPSILPDRKGEPTHAWLDLKEGMRYIRSRRELVVLISAQAMLTLCISPFFVVYVAANKAWFGGRPQMLAWSECAFFLGMIICSPIVGRMKVNRPGLGFALGLAVVGFCVIVMAWSTWVPLFLFLQVICGLGVPFAEIPVTSYLQSSVPDDTRGRVNSVYTMVQVGMSPIGYGLGSLLVDRWGLVVAFIAMGVGMAAAALGGLLDPAFRDAKMPEPVSGELVPA